MGVWIATVWGLTGGLCVEALELYAHICRAPKWDWRCPIDQGMAAFVVAVMLRVSVGAALAAAFAGSHQVSGPLAAYTLGVAAPVVVERLAKAIPLTSGAPKPHSVPQVEAAASETPAQSQEILGSESHGGHIPPITEDLSAGDGDAF
jgi:hypothetical protein